MKVFISFLLGFTFLQTAYSQDIIDGRWRDYLSLTNGKGVVSSANLVWVNTDRGLFSFDPNEDILSKKTKVNGLSDIDVTALAYSQEASMLLLGYQNGNIDLIDGSVVRNLTDIKRSEKYIGKKNINKIVVKNEMAYFCTDFGVVVLNLEQLLVSETWILGSNGSEIPVFDLVFDDNTNSVYAATTQGLLEADAQSSLVFFGNWSPASGLPGGFYNNVAFLGENIVANKYSLSSNEDSLFILESGNWNYFPTIGTGRVNDLQTGDDRILITKDLNVLHYSVDKMLLVNISSALFAQDRFKPTAAIYLPNRKETFIADWGEGLYRVKEALTTKRFAPYGPNSNEVFSLSGAVGTVYINSGAINEVWSPTFSGDGFMRYRDFEWSHYPSSEINEAKDIVDAIENPNDPTEFYAASWGSGLVHFKNNEFVEIYNPSNTNGAIQAGNGGTVRIGGMAYDDQGTLWMTNSIVANNLVSLSAEGVWSNYSLGQVGGINVNVKTIKINGNQKWMQARNEGLLVFDENIFSGPQAKKVSNAVNFGNLPSNNVYDFDVDLDGEVWIGTAEGLVVMYATEEIFESAGATYQAQPILFEEDGVVQKLLGEQAVTSVTVDGANKKWLGTQSSGLFYVSADGLEVIHHFTQENSPLISNYIIDVEIDDQSGEVFIGTPLGMVSFKGAATKGFDSYTDVFAYPNPVEPGYEGPIAIKGLVTNARVKITDVAGNIVFETIAEGGQAFWDGRNLNGVKVASGVYLAYLTNDDGSKTEVTKILIVR